MVEYNEAWRKKAHAVIEDVARSNRLVVSDMVIAALEQAEMGLNNYSGLGGVFKRAANAGFIAKTDETQAGNRKSHSAKTVWRSLIYKDAVAVSPELEAINAMAINALEFNAGTIRLASLVYGHFGELKELIERQPDLQPTLALGTRLILNTSVNLGDYASIVLFGTDEMTPETIISKKELVRFAKDVLNKLEGKAC